MLVHSQTATGIDAFAFVEPNGQARRVTPQEALRIAECEPATSSVERLDDHHGLTAAALEGPLRTPIGRAIGALQGVRGRVWRRLHDQMDTFTDNLLFTKADLEAAHEAINERPLYDKESSVRVTKNGWCSTSDCRYCEMGPDLCEEIGYWCSERRKLSNELEQFKTHGVVYFVRNSKDADKAFKDVSHDKRIKKLYGSVKHI